jgi:Lon protease-like protein
MQPETVIPLFPLGLVLLPQMPLPLHIFEERYKLIPLT